MRINGVPKSGREAYKEGVPAISCPYMEEDPDFIRWNNEWDDAADEAEAEREANKPPKAGSVITNRYRANYADAGHPTHCGDELANLLNGICHNKSGTNLQIFEAICRANDVDLSEYNRTRRGWQGRLRMTGRNLLAKRILQQDGYLNMPPWMGEPRKLSSDWLEDAKIKFKPK